MCRSRGRAALPSPMAIGSLTSNFLSATQELLSTTSPLRWSGVPNSNPLPWIHLLAPHSRTRTQMKLPRSVTLLLLYLCLFLLFPPTQPLSSDGEALLCLFPSSAALPPTWDPSNPDPCSWKGVTCSPQQRVISLSLPNTFLNLSSLPEKLSSLASLQLLNLSSSNISGSVPPSFGLLSNLRLLDLSANILSGPIPPQLGALSNLQFLFLNSNHLTGSIPCSFGNLTGLQVLCLQDNLLNGSIPPELGFLRSLQQLRIGGNPLLGGLIPPELGSLTNLTTFGAAATGLYGPIPAAFGSLINLQTLAVYNSDVSGPIPAELGSCAQLRNLFLHMNRINGTIPPELGKLQELASLLLWGNFIDGSIPIELSNCSSLVILDLSDNKLSGDLPGELGRLGLLEQIHLSDNLLSGAIPFELSNCSSLSTLQLDNNRLVGSIPAEFGALMSLKSLFLWGNLLSGSIPPSLGNCTELYSLDLSKNRLNGSIPDQIFSLKKLSKLLLLGNELSGELPRSVRSCQSLVRLRLGENKLTGSIPSEIGTLQNLVFLDLHLNQFTGRLPAELANNSVLELLDVHGNYMDGEIPSRLSELMNLEQLDLSYNCFSGGIPSSFGNLSYLNKLILGTNLLKGPLPKSISNLQKLTLLDLSCNFFSGPVPPGIGMLTSLTIGLNLSSNEFSGEIPQEISNLVLLQSLDLSRNMLYGGIRALSSLTSLTFLNISFNNFSGPIPVTPVFRSMSTKSYLGNPNLCSSLDGLHCSSYLIRANPLKSVDTISLICVLVGAILVLLTASWILIKRRAAADNEALDSSPLEMMDDLSYPWKFTPFQKVCFTMENILECLRDENIIGKGFSGIVYRAAMPSGELIAVKRIWRSGKEETDGAFASEIQILGNIRHRNIVRLLGYCSNRRTDLLLYNYIPNGNLQQLLQQNRNLDWEIRYKIAMGSAQGLAYLHHDCVPSVLHRDVKCNNILLDSKFEAYLADFGLAKLMNSNIHNAMSRIAGSYGYIAPEYGYTTNITAKSDVYSYGVVLLEILSGRSAIEPQLGDGLHIVEWAKKKMGSFEPAVKVLDSKLQGLPDQLVQEMLQTLGIAMFCVNSMPSERPTMKEVVALLMEVKSPPEEWGKTCQQPLMKTTGSRA